MLTIVAGVVVLVGGGALFFGWRLRETRLTVGWVVGMLGMLVLTTGLYVALTVPSRVQLFTAPTQAITLLLAAVALYASVRLWRHHSHLNEPPHVNRTNLSIALGGGAAVAIGLAGIQLFLTSLADAEEVARAEASELARAKTLYEDIRLRIALAPDLTGFSPPVDPRSPDDVALDMSNFSLRGKRLAMANLEGVRMRGADMVMTDLRGALLSDAELNRGEGPTDLRAATLRNAILHRTQLNEVNLTEADLRGAYVHGTDFDGAILEWADLRGLRCGADTNFPRDCTDEDLVALGLPSYADRPTTACWPGDEAIGERAECGAYARLVLERGW